MALGDRAGAIAAYERVPDSSSGYLDAQTADRLPQRGNGSREPVLDDLLAAGSILESLPIDAAQQDRLTVDLLEGALKLTLAGKAPPDTTAMLVGHRLVERDLRVGLERSYRSLARHAGSRVELIALVDQANRSRPRTWMSGATELRCAACRASLAPGDRFCETCGAGYRGGRARWGACRVCGAPDGIDADGYCTVCGARERPAEDRIEARSGGRGGGQRPRARAPAQRGRVHARVGRRSADRRCRV
jgi:hypothetical protein